MRLLLDENLPKRLKADFNTHDVNTVFDLAWNGIQNGKLLQLMAENGIYALLTFDKNLQHQQNFEKYSITVFVLSAKNNTYQESSPLVPQINSYLSREKLPSGPIIIQLK